jgi:ABC-type sugar transport system ATPase subunit
MPNGLGSDKLMLDAREITKTFPGVRALDRVSFDLRHGEVHALVGENGAGKSTLMHILGGVYQPDSGQLVLDGKPLIVADPHDAARHGISVVFQELSLSENLSIAENVFANSQPIGALNMIDWRELHRKTTEILAQFEWDIDPATPAGDLGTAKQQIVEIMKAVARNPRVLILDEPTSSLTAIDTRVLFANVRAMKARGVSVIYISHHLSEIFELADRVTVLRDGQLVETCAIGDVTEDDLVRKMVGRELVDMYGIRTAPTGKERFRIDNAELLRDNKELVRDMLSPQPIVRDMLSRMQVPRTCSPTDDAISFSISAGEIVGLAGLAGAGRTELARAIFGAERMDSGRLSLDGEPLTIRSPEDAIAAGIAYLSEDRKGDGLFLDMSVRENCVAPSLREFAGRLGLMDDRAVAVRAEEYRERFGIVTPSVAQKVGFLSGGNQQKVLLAMWFGIRPRLLIADEPTRGVDVGAKCEIYHLLRELAADGVAILLISSDLPEVLGLSDRVLVMRNGQIAGGFARSDATEETIIACAAGVATND